MKTIKLSLTLIAALAITSFINPLVKQESEKKIASADVKTLEGKVFNTSAISNNGKPIIVSIWETTCQPCIKELDAIADDYSEWQKETGVKVVAISIDNSRTISNVGPIVKSKGWEYEVYTDVNQDFKRAMNIGFCPHTYLLDGQGNVVWEKESYSEGDEILVYEMVKKLSKGEKISSK